MDIDTAVKGYMSARERLEANFSNPNQISDLIFKMSTYLSHIGDHLGELKAQYETQRGSRYLQNVADGLTTTNAENLSRAGTADLRGQINKLELQLKTGLNLVNVGQTRIKVLESEARNQT